MMRKFLLVLVFAVALAGCGGAAQPSTEIVLEATDFAFRPVSITVPAGQPVKLTLTNRGVVEHDFVIETINVSNVEASHTDPAAHHQVDQTEYDLHFFAKAGEMETLQFTALEPGTYEIFCSIEGHKEAGMIGELIVIAQE